MASIYHDTRFSYAPPKLEGEYYPYREPKPPYPDAPGWQCSVYFFWYEYLRRHEGYAECCRRGGQGECSALYEDFGDVHNTDFMSWWQTHHELFAEPRPAFLVFKHKLKAGQEINGSGFIEYVQIDLRFSETDIIRRVRDLVRIQKQRTAYQFERYLKTTGGDPALAGAVKARRRVLSQAKYRVTTKPILPTLYQHLRAWDARIENPDMSDADLFDIAGLELKLPYSLKEIEDLRSDGLPVHDLEASNRRAKSLAVQRHLRIARQYIDNVATGRFPLRSGR